MNSEEPKGSKAGLTWGDVAFGLEVARWRLRRAFTRHEILRRVLGLNRFTNRLAQPGLLLIEIQGLSHARLQRALKEGKMPFLQHLIDVENYEILSMSSDSFAARTHDLAQLAGVPSPGKSLGNLVSRLGAFRKLRPQTRSALDLVRGLPFVRASFRAPENDNRELNEISRAIRNLHGLALLNPSIDYAVWIVSGSLEEPAQLEKPLGFIMLPANTPLPGRAKEPLDGSELTDAVRHTLGRQSISRREATRAGEPRRILRVISYNIHSCVGLDGKLSPGRIARIIRGFDPDIVALQEVDVVRGRSRGEDQAARLARELEMEVAFCFTVNHPAEKYGHALLTRFPVEVIASGIFGEMPARLEPRGVLLVKGKWAGQDIYLANTHFGLGTTERFRQMESFLGPKWLGRVPADAPLIVCGDFNMTSAASAYELMAHRLQDTQTSADNRNPSGTFPSPIPLSRIDFIFVSKHFVVSKVNVPRNSLTRVASDHLPLIVDLELSSARFQG